MNYIYGFLIKEERHTLTVLSYLLSPSFRLSLKAREMQEWLRLWAESKEEDQTAGGRKGARKEKEKSSEELRLKGGGQRSEWAGIHVSGMSLHILSYIVDQFSFVNEP